MTIRTDADIRRLREQGDLTSAEETLIQTCRAGKLTFLEDGEVPDGPSDTRTVRADLLRYLITGGCSECPTQDVGVDLFGAYVTGSLDLNFATAKGRTGLYACRFENRIDAWQTRFELLNFNRSHLPALTAQGARVTGHVFLRKVQADGEVSLSGAVIGGQLACAGARFSNAKEIALEMQRAQVTGDVFLCEVEAEGEVSLAGTKIGGQLVCEVARFSNAKGRAINAQKMEVKGGFLWREVTSVKGIVDLSSARVADLVDDASSWELVDRLHLNGLRYEHIHEPLTATMRLKWLAKDAATKGEFRPQPYEQLAQVMQSMGHTSDARRVRLEKEILLARDWRRRAIEEHADLRARRDGTPKPPDHHEIQNRLTRIWLDLRIIPLWHGALRYMVGYGHAPQRVLAWAAVTIGVMWSFYLWVWNFGGMVPNSAIVLTSPQWASALAENPDFPALAWIASETGQHYETFSAFAYAADVFIPLVDLGQEAAWTATTATAWGSLAWVLSWFLKLFGWIVTAVGAAAITGIIRRE
ncbi:hypothetical protein [Roseovarius sp. D22-M7]|uniref:hypothetical protein n=1 Tax=Roseovarius sp. D22-M7 TaxID=3127116 RepID=UPI0030105832